MERTFDVYWEGPFSIEQVQSETDSNHALYAVYSTHQVYGRNVLVYIGMTEQELRERIKQHAPWLDLECDPVQVYAASIGPFTTWKAADRATDYPKPPREDILAIEALLVFAHQPAYNTSAKHSALQSKNLRIFNTGRFGSLFPEVSGRYFLGE